MLVRMSLSFLIQSGKPKSFLKVIILSNPLNPVIVVKVYEYGLTPTSLSLGMSRVHVRPGLYN